MRALYALVATATTVWLAAHLATDAWDRIVGGVLMLLCILLMVTAYGRRS